MAMDAQPILALLARTFADHKLEVILIGKPGAALHGAPVSTVDVDFLFHRTPQSMRKLKTVTIALGGQLMQPYYPLSGLHRESDGLQVDFMTRIDGIRSFESLRSRARPISIGGATLLVADLKDIVQSKKATGRPKDLAELATLEATLHEIETAAGTPPDRSPKGKRKSAG
jgi:hypothetical protein